MPIDTLTGKNWQFPLIIVYLKHDFIQLYLFFRQISKNYYMYAILHNYMYSVLFVGFWMLNITFLIFMVILFSFITIFWRFQSEK
jgi:hypothetical protein